VLQLLIAQQLAQTLAQTLATLAIVGWGVQGLEYAVDDLQGGIYDGVIRGVLRAQQVQTIIINFNNLPAVGGRCLLLVLLPLSGQGLGILVAIGRVASYELRQQEAQQTQGSQHAARLLIRQQEFCKKKKMRKKK